MLPGAADRIRASAGHLPHTARVFATWIYNGAMLSLALLSAPRWRHRPTAAAALLAAGLALIPAACSLEGFDVFGFLRLFGWSCFGWLPAVLVIACGPSPVLRRAAAGALLAIAGWAYGVEPHWLEVTRHEIVGAVERPTRLVLLADLQTDSVGAWEQGVLRRAFQELQPDLVLLAGDYVQRERGGFTAEAQRLQAVLREVAGGVPAFAVQGDVDDPGWEVQFEGTGIAASARSRTVAVAGLSLTVLGLQDSRSVSPRCPRFRGSTSCWATRRTSRSPPLRPTSCWPGIRTAARSACPGSVPWRP